MNYLLVLLTLFFSCTLTTSCSSINSAMGGNSEKDALANIVWSYGPNALQLSLDSDAALNTYDGEAHSVVLAVVQSAEPAPFYSQLQTPDTLAKLLQTGQPTPGLLQVTRYAVEPGHQTMVQLDRAQGAKYAGVIVAYYGVPLARTAKLFNLPVTVEKKGIIASYYSAKPAAANIQVKLGAESLINTEITTLPPTLPAKGEAASAPTTGILILNDLNTIP